MSGAIEQGNLHFTSQAKIMERHKCSQPVLYMTTSELTDIMLGHCSSPLTTTSPIFPQKLPQNFHPKASANSINSRMEASLITLDHPDSGLSGNSTSGSSSEVAKGSGASISKPKRSLAPIQDDPNSDKGELEGIKAINSQEEATIRLAAASTWREVMHAKCHLALCLVQEHDVLCQLY
ncbi:hypothetical protein EV401DRAFT_1892230 [Pisolithus croceorrhizus]|nr:hypothetical protein EV401DRAFT_1892230 [Pisolithus croceorrhizus]